MTTHEDAMEFCQTHKATTFFNLHDAHAILFHGLDDAEEYAYVSEVYGTTTKFHKVRVQSNKVNGLMFVKIDYKRYYLADFTKLYWCEVEN